jgi:hypothetical protein
MKQLAKLPIGQLILKGELQQGYELGPADVGKLIDWDMGTVKRIDVGKKVYADRQSRVTQMENREQRDTRFLIEASSKVDFRRTARQIVRDMGGETRIIRCAGPCARCGGRVYEADDMDNDPRGVMGLRVRYEPHGVPGYFVFCWACAGETQKGQDDCLKIAGGV